MRLAYSLTQLAGLGIAYLHPPNVQEQRPIELEAPGGPSPNLDADLLSHHNQPLRCLQVSTPVLGPDGPLSDASPLPDEHERCSGILMEHVFGFSYGKPFVGTYTPPDCDFNRVVLNLTVKSSGRQFDRLAVMFLNDTEIWRTSTAEPKPAPGIIWNQLKDVTPYLSLWKTPQKLIFDLGNLVDDKYTGSFNCTLTAQFFTSPTLEPDAEPADVIIPVSAMRSSGDQASAWNVPQQKATRKVGLPRNARRAVFSISANGQMDEEFWWSNLLQSDAGVFNETAGRMPGLSPFREVQLLIGGQLAGVQWPFPVIFTGGVSPGLHRPIVGIDAFDLREHEIDVTPWLPVLCDGENHRIDIRVMGIYDNGEVAELTDRVGHYWVVTGKFFVWLDEPGSVVTGKPPTVDSAGPEILMSSTTAQNGSRINEALEYSLHIQRKFSVDGEITRSGTKEKAAWKQELSYSNHGLVTCFGSCQINAMNMTGFDQAHGRRQYEALYSFPLWANQTYNISPSGNLSIEAQLNQTLDLEVRGQATFPTGLEAFQYETDLGAALIGSRLSTSRHGHASFSQSGDKRHSTGHGSTRQIFVFLGLRPGHILPPAGLYFRNVSAVNDTITLDHEVMGRLEREVLLPEAAGRGGAYQGHFAPVKGKEGMKPDSTHGNPSHLQPA